MHPDDKVGLIILGAVIFTVLVFSGTMMTLGYNHEKEMLRICLNSGASFSECQGG